MRIQTARTRVASRKMRLDRLPFDIAHIASHKGEQLFGSRMNEFILWHRSDTWRFSKVSRRAATTLGTTHLSQMAARTPAAAFADHAPGRANVGSVPAAASPVHVPTAMVTGTNRLQLLVRIRAVANAAVQEKVVASNVAARADADFAAARLP